MQFLLLPLKPRFLLLTISLVATIAILLFATWHQDLSIYLAAPLVFFGAFALLGLRDITQTKHAILRNYPIAAHLRFLLENIRPEMRQYFFEAEKDGTPFPRDKRAIVYQGGSISVPSARTIMFAEAAPVAGALDDAQDALT